MKKYNVYEKKTGNLLISLIIYDKRMVKPLILQFKKLPQVNISEVIDEKKRC